MKPSKPKVAVRPKLTPSEIERLRICRAVTTSLIAAGHSVVRVKPYTKQPAYPGWRTATRSLEELEEDFESELPSFGAVLKASQRSIVVDIDVDRVKSIDGFATLKRMEINLDAALITPVVTFTPRGGCHLWFDVGDAVFKGGTSVAPGIDLRSFGDLVLLPGSLHPSGSVYGGSVEWLACIGSLPPLPQEFVPYFQHRSASAASATYAREGS